MTEAQPSPASIPKSLYWWNIAGLVALFLLLRWNNFSSPLTRDEGADAYSAQLLLGGGLPYEMSFLQKPPMIAYSYALGGLLAPNTFWAPRMVADIFAAGATALLAYIAWLEFGADVALATAWFMTPMILLPRLEQYIANTEMFMLLPLMAVFAIYVHARHKEGGARSWCAAGIFAALTICYKYTVVLPLAAVFAAWSWETWRKNQRSELIRYWCAALGGGTAAAALVLAPFLLHDGGRRLWECTVTFNRNYVNTALFTLEGFHNVLARLWESWWILFLAHFLLLIRAVPRIWFWSAIYCFGWLSTFGSYYSQYYIPVMPFWALLTAVAVRTLARQPFGTSALPIRWLAPVLTLFLTAAICASDVSWLIRSPARFTADRLAPDPCFLEAPMMGERLKQITSSRDYVYIAGSEPEILCYAHRVNPTRFDIAYPLMLTRLAATYQAEAARSLVRNPPAAVVYARGHTSWLTQPESPRGFLDFLNNFLNANYEVVGCYLSDTGQAQWQSRPTRDQLARCDLILLKRKAAK